MPAFVSAFVEELFRVVPGTEARTGRRQFGIALHRFERGGVNQDRPSALIHRSLQRSLSIDVHHHILGPVWLIVGSPAMPEQGAINRCLKT